MERSSLSESLLREVETRAIQWVREGGRRALAHFRLPLRVEFKAKGETSPVTDADREIEGYLRDAITREYPDHGILGEEGTEKEVEERGFFWALDPVDGTANFWNGLPLFACSAALLWHGEPVVGAVFLSVIPLPVAEKSNGRGMAETRAPVPHLRGGVIHARRDGGACLEGVPIQASRVSTPGGSQLIGLPGYHSRQFKWVGSPRMRPGEPRSLGSICYEMALVATGVLQYSVYRRPNVWDVASGVLIVREAGGRSLLWRGERWEPFSRFYPMPNPKKAEENGFRFWSLPLLVGGSQTALYAAERLRPR